MTKDAVHSAESSMLVVVHDFSPVFLSELEYVADRLEPLLGCQMSAAVVPRWHGYLASRTDAAFCKLLTRFSERLLHGWTHQSTGRMRPLSLLTGGADELRGFDEVAILERLQSAQADFRELTGAHADGLLPPAWQLPILASRLSAFKFVMRYSRLESCEGRYRRYRLATTSWDWGRLGWVGHAGEWMGRLLHWTYKSAIPCIAIHPIDVRRGFFDRAVALIETLARAGYRAVTASTLMSVPENKS